MVYKTTDYYIISNRQIQHILLVKKITIYSSYKIISKKNEAHFFTKTNIPNDDSFNSYEMPSNQ